MDTPATATTSTISLVEYNKYLQLYSEILDSLVEMSNQHQKFKKRRGMVICRTFRKSIRKIELQLKDLKHLVTATATENAKNWPVRVAISRQLTEAKKHRKKYARIKHNQTTPTIIQ